MVFWVWAKEEAGKSSAAALVGRWARRETLQARTSTPAGDCNPWRLLTTSLGSRSDGPRRKPMRRILKDHLPSIARW